ncbi:MAG: PAS domain S-box protein, partial [Acidobacteria bacterium]
MQNGTKPSPARRLWNGLAPRDSDDEEQLRIGNAVRLLGVGAFVGIVPFLFLEWRSGWMPQVWLLSIVELVLLGALWLNRRGQVRMAALALNATALVCGAALVFLSAAGYRDVSLLLFPGIPVLAGLLLPRSYYWAMSAAAVLVAASLILLQIHGLIPYATQPGAYIDLIATVVILMLTSVAVGYLVVALGNSRRLAQATIDALWHHTCVLDGKGMVLAVTRASRLADVSPPIPLPASVSVNYLDLCEKASGSKARETAAFAAGLRAVLRGEQEEFAMEYACHSPCEDRCFLTKVRRVGAPGAIRVVIAHEDVTGQRRAEQALRVSEEQHRQLVQNLHAGVVVHGPDTRILLANEQACRLLGLSEEEIRGKAAVDPVWAFFRPDETPLPLQEYPVNQVLASRSPVRDLVSAVRRPGTEDLVWLLVNAFPELGPRGELRQVVVT